MIKVIAIDHDIQTLNLIRIFCLRTGFLNCIKSFTDSGQALRHLKKFPVDLIFLDNSISSLFYASLRKTGAPIPMVIFLSASSENAIEGFNQNALDFMIKPLSFERFMNAAGKAKIHYSIINQYYPPQEIKLMLRVKYALVRIPLATIIYIEGMDDYIRIYLSDQKPIITKVTMKEIEEKLPRYNFVRTHRSYIVPIDKINSVRNKIVFINNCEIPLGGSYEENFFDVLNNKTDIAVHYAC